jgi:uncharacterized protein (TIGR03032 family)
MAANPTPPAPAATDAPFRSINSVGLADLLEAHGLTLIVTTYQAGKLMAVRGAQGRISTLLRTFDRPMGLALQDGRQFALGTRYQVWLLRNAPDIAPQIEPKGKHDACFLPRQCFVTGDIRGHEMAWAGDELWIVNTHFSCLCTPHPEYSFVPRWRPPFVTALTPDDRCHLNGLALAPDERGVPTPRYVTALGETDTPNGWRADKARGGLLIDVPSGAVVARGLSMPHSPRVYAGRVWVLDSGSGQLRIVDPASGRSEPVAELPGFTRGLAFYGPYAFVGLSQIRETAQFGGLPIAERRPDLRCGVWVIDLRTGRVEQFMQFEAGVEEIFAVEVLAGIRFPEIVGFQQETIQGAFVIPP